MKASFEKLLYCQCENQLVKMMWLINQLIKYYYNRIEHFLTPTWDTRAYPNLTSSNDKVLGWFDIMKNFFFVPIFMTVMQEISTFKKLPYALPFQNLNPTFSYTQHWPWHNHAFQSPRASKNKILIEFKFCILLCPSIWMHNIPVVLSGRQIT